MNVEQPFASGDSPLHRLDPRVKVLAAAGLSVATAILTDLFLAVFALAGALCLLLSARVGFRAAARRLALANLFIGVMWLVLPWSVPGRAVATIGHVELTREGLALAGRITVKCNAILMALIALLATSTLADLAHALQRLRVPQRLLMIFFFCVRYLSVIHSEFVRLTHAMKARAFTPAANLRTYRTYANMLGTLVVRAHARAARIHQAMLCRGFSGSFPMLRRFRLRTTDVVAGLMLLAFAGLLAVLQWKIGKS